MRAAATDTGEGLLLSTFAVLRMGAAQQAANDPAKRELMAKKEELEQKIDVLKYQKAAMDPGRLQNPAHRSISGPGASPGGSGQMKAVMHRGAAKILVGRTCAVLALICAAARHVLRRNAR